MGLQEQFEQAKLELKLEHQNKFGTNKQKQANGETIAEQAHDSSAEKRGKKRAAPIGHSGWFRPTPTQYDWDVHVSSPKRCPRCQMPTRILASADPLEHLQEDIVEGVYRVVLYRHGACRCDASDCMVQRAGKGELLGSRIGPNLRAKAIYLRHVIGISYRKVPSWTAPLWFWRCDLSGFLPSVYLA